MAQTCTYCSNTIKHIKSPVVSSTHNECLLLFDTRNRPNFCPKNPRLRRFSPQGVPRLRDAVPAHTRRPTAYDEEAPPGLVEAGNALWQHSHHPFANRGRPRHAFVITLACSRCVPLDPRVDGRHRGRRMSSLWSECSRLTLLGRSARRFRQYSRHRRSVLSRSAHTPTHHAV
jgi:hypothetical protein